MCSREDVSVEQKRHRIKVIYNPQANHGRNAHLADDLRRLTAELGGADWSSTQHPGHAVELAAQTARSGYERILSVGGDGTLHEIMNGLMQADPRQRPVLGIVPVGSGNDFVRGTAMFDTPTHAVERSFDGTCEKPIDVGYVRLNGGAPQYWVNVVGIGFDASVTLHSKRLAWLPGKLMYFVAAVLTIVVSYDAPAMRVSIDGRETAQRVQMLTIGNGPREGGSFITTPAAVVDDGRLDYTMFDPVSRAMMVRLIPEVMRGTHGRFRQAHVGTFTTLALTADRPLPIHSDGEMIATAVDNVRQVEVGIAPAAIRLVC